MSKNELKAKSLQRLPLGSIKPQGLLRRQLRIQADGLSGHLDEIWEDVGENSRWFGGEVEGWERGPYYADGLLPLAYLLDDDALKEKALKWVRAFLDGQTEDGWIGPIKGSEKHHPEYDPWPIFVVFKVLVQYYEVSGDKECLEVMLRFCSFLKENLVQNPLSSWAKFRWADLLVSLQWLWEKTHESVLLELADLLKEQGYDWGYHFTNFRYKKKQPVMMETHVVNNAMGIKTPALWHRHSKAQEDHDAFYKAIENLDVFHGQVTGIFTGDEHFSGRNPSQGTELCAVVELMYSLGLTIEVLGDPLLCDRLEKIAYNALPATFSPDMWAHQYDQQANQVLCTVGERNWSNGPDANIFGLEPNFGCCTANMHQGWPKFVGNLWMKTPNGLAAVAYGPSEVQTELGTGDEIRIVEKTDYPFDDVIEFAIEASKPVPFTLSFRIPVWASDAKVKLPDGQIIPGTAGRFVDIQRTWSPGDMVQLTLERDLDYERRYHGAVAISYGPLVFSLKIAEEWQLLKGTPPHGDWEIHPRSFWNYGLNIDLDDLSSSIEVIKKEVGKSPFSPEGAPIELHLKGRLVPEWRLKGNVADEIPHSPVYSSHPDEVLTLIPYGATNLRVTEFPLIGR